MLRLKFVLPLVAILLIAGGVFAMNTVKKSNRLVSYKWFQINANKPPGAAVTNAVVTYLGEGTTPPSGTGCGGSTYQCVSGFNASQVNGSNQLIGSQTPVVEPSRKN